MGIGANDRVGRPCWRSATCVMRSATSCAAALAKQIPARQAPKIPDCTGEQVTAATANADRRLEVPVHARLPPVRRNGRRQGENTSRQAGSLIGLKSSRVRTVPGVESWKVSHRAPDSGRAPACGRGQRPAGPVVTTEDIDWRQSRGYSPSNMTISRPERRSPAFHDGLMSRSASMAVHSAGPITTT